MNGKLTVAELQVMLALLDPSEKVGYYDGNGGTTAASTVEYVEDAHDPECDCGCVSIVLI